MKLKNIELLRNHLLESLEKLEKGNIDVEEAAIIAKSSEAIGVTLKLQLQYSQMIGQDPYIPFLHDCHTSQEAPKLIETKKLK